jgi:hypothetical protein
VLPGRAQQRPQFRAGVSVVRLDVLASDRGKPIAGLTPHDFEVTDNGVRQTVELATTADRVAVVFSASGRNQTFTNDRAKLVQAVDTLVHCNP